MQVGTLIRMSRIFLRRIVSKREGWCLSGWFNGYSFVSYPAYELLTKSNIKLNCIDTG